MCVLKGFTPYYLMLNRREGNTKLLRSLSGGFVVKSIVKLEESCIRYEFVDSILFVGLYYCRRISALARGVGNDRASVEGFGSPNPKEKRTRNRTTYMYIRFR